MEGHRTCLGQIPMRCPERIDGPLKPYEGRCLPSHTCQCTALPSPFLHFPSSTALHIPTRKPEIAQLPAQEEPHSGHLFLPLSGCPKLSQVCLQSLDLSPQWEDVSRLSQAQPLITRGCVYSSHVPSLPTALPWAGRGTCVTS